MGHSQELNYLEVIGTYSESLPCPLVVGSPLSSLSPYL